MSISTGIVEMGHIRHLGQVLDLSRSRLAVASVSVPGQRSMVFRPNLDRLFRRQVLLETDLENLRRALGQAQFGFWGWVIGAGVAGVAALGAMIFKQNQETQEVETRMEIYNTLVRNGVDPEEASRRAFGGGGGLGGIMDKLLILGALSTGLIIYFKLGKKS